MGEQCKGPEKNSYQILTLFLAARGSPRQL